MMEVLKDGLMCIFFNPVIVKELGKGEGRWDMYMGRQAVFISIKLKNVSKRGSKKYLRNQT